MTRNANNKMEIMRVVYLGLIKSTRTRKMTNMNKKQTPQNQKNKPEDKFESATPHYTQEKKQHRSSKLAKLKMTTPCKVKTASTFRRQPKSQEFPRTLNLMRLNTLKSPPVKPRSN